MALPGDNPGLAAGSFDPASILAAVQANPAPALNPAAVTGPAPAHPGPGAGGFTWGTGEGGLPRHWGPNDFAAFTAWLGSRGVSISQWARNHPAAFALFNLDPMLKQAVLSGHQSAVGGMGHK